MSVSLKLAQGVSLEESTSVSMCRSSMTGYNRIPVGQSLRRGVVVELVASVMSGLSISDSVHLSHAARSSSVEVPCRKNSGQRRWMVESAGAGVNFLRAETPKDGEEVWGRNASGSAKLFQGLQGAQVR